MNELEAISLATPIIRSHPIAKEIDFSGVTATFTDGNEAMVKLRAEWPDRKFKFELNDYWRVRFPLSKEDEFQRKYISVDVNPETKTATLVEECL